MTGYGYNVLFYGQNPDHRNYYLFLLYKNHILYSDTITEVVFPMMSLSMECMFETILCIAFVKPICLKTQPYNTRNVFCKPQYYEFMSALMTETIWKGSPWDGPPVIFRAISAMGLKLFQGLGCETPVTPLLFYTKGGLVSNFCSNTPPFKDLRTA